MEHRTFVPAFGALAAALTSIWISTQASAVESYGVRKENDGWANIEIIPNERVTVVPKTVFSIRPDGSPPGYLVRWLRHDHSTTGAAATLWRVHLELDGNGKAFALGGCDARTNGDGASGRDAEG